MRSSASITFIELRAAERVPRLTVTLSKKRIWSTTSRVSAPPTIPSSTTATRSSASEKPRRAFIPRIFFISAGGAERRARRLGAADEHGVLFGGGQHAGDVGGDDDL